MVSITGERNEVQLLTTAIHSLGRDNGHTDDKEGFRRTQTQMIGSVRGYLLSSGCRCREKIHSRSSTLHTYWVIRSLDIVPTYFSVSNYVLLEYHLLNLLIDTIVGGRVCI